MCYLQEIHFTGKDMYRLKVKGLKKIHHANGNPKQTGVHKLIDKTEPKSKTEKRQRST